MGETEFIQLLEQRKDEYYKWQYLGYPNDRNDRNCRISQTIEKLIEQLKDI